MRFTTSSTPINAYIFSAVALLSLIPAANADEHGVELFFSDPGDPGAPNVVAEQNYWVKWYVPRGKAER
jgi:hypothetical protein